MRKGEYKPIDTKVVREQILEVDEKGEQIVRIIEKEIPIMGLVYRDMTEEEEAEYNKSVAELPPIEPTLEEQLADLIDLVGVLTEVICND